MFSRMRHSLVEKEVVSLLRKEQPVAFYRTAGVTLDGHRTVICRDTRAAEMKAGNLVRGINANTIVSESLKVARTQQIRRFANASYNPAKKSVADVGRGAVCCRFGRFV